MMKPFRVVLVVAVCLLTGLAAPSAQEKPQLKTPKDKFAYALGMNLGMFLKKLGAQIDLKLVIRGVEDTLTGKTLMTQQEAAQARSQFMQKARNDLSAKNKKAGETFLAQNKAKKGVKTTASGLQYVVVKEGTGPKPKATDKVKVHYRGTLIDGTEFDSSHKRGKPAEFAVNKVIRGWTEGLQLMKVGSKYKFFIPSEIAYGKRGAGALIGPDAVLIFDVELLAIVQ